MIAFDVGGRLGTSRNSCAMVRAIVLLSLAVATFGGCSYEDQMRRVAKDWCLTIRAAQVLPVYPLTEDLQPGDVFLVTLPSNEQEKLYKTLGYLPLDVQVTRLNVTTASFDSYYAPQYFDGDYASGGQAHERLKRRVSEDGSTDPFAQSYNVPRASFPTYSVDVKRSGGFKAAIPVQAIPVGVGLLGADSATASVTIADAYTYAADPADLAAKLRVWAASGDAKLVLREYTYGRPENEPLFLRVVQRVYLTGGVKVAITRTSQGSGGVDAGVAQNVGGVQPSDKATIDRWSEAQEALGEALNSGLLGANAMPGASLRFAGATSRSVTLDERFDRPLAIGYIAVDYEIRQDGSLGAALSTRDVLNGRAKFSSVRQGPSSDLDIAISAMHSQVATLARGSQQDQDRAIAIVRTAVANMPGTATEYDRVRQMLEPTTAPDALATARALSMANNRYRSGEAGSGPKTESVFLALVTAIRAASPGGQ